MVSQCPTCVVRRGASKIVLKAYSSYAPGPIDPVLGRKHRDGMWIKNSENRFDRKSKMAAMVAILKI